jgi:hypothetical protein
LALTIDEVAQLSDHNPDKFRINPAAMPAEQQAVVAGNPAALTVYGGTPSMGDPTLRTRLCRIARADAGPGPGLLSRTPAAK